MRSTWLLMLSVVLWGFSVIATAAAENSLQVELALIQKTSENSEAVTVDLDTFTVSTGLMSEARIGNVVFHVDLLALSDDEADLRIEMVTSGQKPKRAFETCAVHLGLPVMFDSVIVKGASFYRAYVKPLGSVGVDTSCRYYITDSESYSSDPAPHFQIYFVPQSLGDYHWNAMRAFLEMEYKELGKFSRFDDLQPVNLYLMPCVPPSLHVDDHHGFMIDPTRNSVMVVYNHERKANASLATNMLKFYRFWGYAPLFFVEGIASFSDFNDYYVQNHLRTGDVPDIGEHFISVNYSGHPDRVMLRRVAGSFCGYLVNVYGIGAFKRFYEISSDLTALDDFQGAYGRSADLLIADWRHYLDTLTIDPGLLGYHAQRVSYLRDYREAVSLLEERLRRTGDSRRQASELGDYYYRVGDYENAQRYFGMCVDGDDLRARDIVTHANMLLINGLLDSACATYERAISVDSTQATAYSKIGHILRHRGDLAGALAKFHAACGMTDDEQVVIDGHLAIGQCLLRLGSRDSSEVYFASALNGAKRYMMGGQPNPLAALRAGEAFVWLGQPEPAIEHLEYAGFIEERPFYLGRLALVLGQAYDLKGDRETALEHYRSVDEIPGAYLHREEAKRYVEKPFTLEL